MSKLPRKHHFVPAFYLAGFTAGGGRDDRLFVFDRERKKQWPSTPTGAGYSNDFYAVQGIPNQGPDSVEVRLAQMESKCSDALRRIIAVRTIPDDEDFGELMAFVASMAARGPRFRMVVADFIDQVSRKELRAALATPELHEQFKAVLKATEPELSAGEQAVLDDYEGLKASVDGDGYDVDVDQTWLVHVFLQGFITLMPHLAMRQWAIWAPKAGAPEFVCSDAPVCLTWKDGAHGVWPPGFGIRNTAVSVPLNRSLMLVGTYEPLEANRSLTRDEVALMNRRTLLYANQVYGGEQDFVWESQAGRLIGAAEYIAD
jgi:hypothetical protein